MTTLFGAREGRIAVDCLFAVNCLLSALPPSPQQQNRRTFQDLDAKKPYCFLAIVENNSSASEAERGRWIAMAKE